jgi:hypothetical protein
MSKVLVLQGLDLLALMLKPARCQAMLPVLEQWLEFLAHPLARKCRRLRQLVQLN